MDVVNSANAQVNQYASDEIDLFDLIDDVKANFLWVVASVVIIAALALAYAFKATPVYQTQVAFAPATKVELLELNQPRLNGVYGLSSEQAYQGLRREITSLRSKRDFYQLLLDENNAELLPFIFSAQLTKEQNVSEFAGRFTLAKPKKGEANVLSVSLELADAQWATVLLNRYAQFVMMRYQQEIARSVELLRVDKIAALELQANKLRQKYHSNKERRLLSLREASTVAASINQARPFYSSNDVVVSSEPPMYMMGEKALRSEIAILESRKAEREDSYIAGVSDLLWQIAELKAVAIDWQKVELVRWDQQAVLPAAPVKPKKLLIVILGVVAGGMLGLILALVNAARLRRKSASA